MLYTSIVYIISAFALYFALTNIIPYRFSLKDSIIGISLLLLCLFILYTRLGHMAIFIVLFIFLGYLYYICHHSLNPFLIICCSLIGYICYILSDNILSQIMLNIFHISINDIFNTYNPLFCIISGTITYLLTFFIGELFKRKFNLSSQAFSRPVYLAFLTILSISALMFIYNIINGQRAGYTADNITFNAILIIIYSLVTFCILLIMIRYIQRDAHTKSMLEQYHNLEHYTDELERMNLRFRAFRHDYIDILTTLSAYIENNDMEGLRRTFEDKIAPLGNSMTLSMNRLSSLSHIKIPELKSLISSKTIYAQSHNINVLLDIAEDISELPMDIIDLVRILSIFFNNSIEELCSPDITDKNLEFGIIKKAGSVILVIKNTTTADKHILSAIYELGYSSKGDNRGIGLYTVKKIISNYHNVVHCTTIEDSVFVQTIELYY